MNTSITTESTAAPLAKAPSPTVLAAGEPAPMNLAFTVGDTFQLPLDGLKITDTVGIGYSENGVVVPAAPGDIVFAGPTFTFAPFLTADKAGVARVGITVVRGNAVIFSRHYRITVAK